MADNKIKVTKITIDSEDKFEALQRLFDEHLQEVSVNNADNYLLEQAVDRCYNFIRSQIKREDNESLGSHIYTEVELDIYNKLSKS